MLRVMAFALGVCLSAASVAQADIPAAQAQTSANAKKEAEFKLWVEMGNRAKSAGRYNEAAVLYAKALELQRHPVVAGRLGLALMKLGQVDRAAELLHAAVERGQGVSVQERRAIAEAYDKAKALTTWVNVDVSQAGAKVTCDGEPQNREGYSSFWMFTMPGEHTLRATLDGYEEAVETFTGKAGEEITVTLKLVPLASAKPPDQTEPTLEQLLRKKRRFSPQLPGSNVVGDPNYARNEDPFYGEPKEPKPKQEKKGSRFSVSGGVVTVFGVASWNPAVGGVIGVDWSSNEYFSIGMEGRAAWLTTGVADSAISAMTAGGLLSLCGHVKWFFACPLGHLGVIRTEGAESTFNEAPFDFFRPGVGGRLGVRLRPTQRLSLQATADALALTHRTRIFVGNELIVDQPAAMVGAQITGGWEF